MAMKYRIIRVPRTGDGFTGGMARVVDFGGALNDYHTDELIRIYDGLRIRRLDGLSGLESGYEAVRITWGEVGQCIRNAIGAFESEDSDEHLPIEQFR